MEEASDADLVTAILAGDGSRFAEVVRRFDCGVRRVVARSVADPDGREELVQRTFCLAFRRLGTLADPGRLDRWLLRIARNCVADHHRRQRPHLPLERAAGVEARAADSTWVWEEVAALRPAQAEVLRLRYRDRMSYEEIARRLDVPASTVRGRVHLARKALRARLEDSR